jgi:hypothetical protein
VGVVAEEIKAFALEMLGDHAAMHLLDISEAAVDIVRVART